MHWATPRLKIEARSTSSDCTRPTPGRVGLWHSMRCGDVCSRSEPVPRIGRKSSASPDSSGSLMTMSPIRLSTITRPLANGTAGWFAIGCPVLSKNGRSSKAVIWGLMGTCLVSCLRWTDCFWDKCSGRFTQPRLGDDPKLLQGKGLSQAMMGHTFKGKQSPTAC